MSRGKKTDVPPTHLPILPTHPPTHLPNRVWGRDGSLLHSLSNHEGAIFALKWNPSASYVASGSYDQSTVVWDMHTGQARRKRRRRRRRRDPPTHPLLQYHPPTHPPTHPPSQKKRPITNGRTSTKHPFSTLLVSPPSSSSISPPTNAPHSNRLAPLYPTHPPTHPPSHTDPLQMGESPRSAHPRPCLAQRHVLRHRLCG